MPKFETGSIFTFTEEVCNSYPEKLDIVPLSRGIPTGVLLAKDDELLDYRIAEKVLKPYTYIRYILGGHRLKDYDSLFQEIKEIDDSALV